jgi:hypothetical protein
MISRKKQTIIRMIAWLGERCVIHARTLPSPPVEKRKGPHKPHYIDDTQALRNSIGYVISADGEIVSENFTANGEGDRAAKFARKQAAKFPDGIALIVVAGAKYAAYVSALGYDTIDSAEDLAEREMPRILRQLGFKV